MTKTVGMILVGTMCAFIPSLASSHGHSLTGESRTIFEAYGMACNTALHEVHHHAAISNIRVIPGGILLEIIFPESSDFPYAVAEAMEAWDRAGMGRWHGQIKKARQDAAAGSTLHIRAMQLARHFRDMRQGVCDHPR